MHIELTEMLRCPEPHQEDILVLSTGEMLGRMVRFGILGCPVCRKEYPIARGIVDFTRRGEQGAGSGTAAGTPAPRAPLSAPDPQTLQALLELSGPGGFVVLLGRATRHAVGLAGLMPGIHFIGINAPPPFPPDVEELPILSLLRSDDKIPLRQSIARGVVVGADLATSPWLVEANRILLRGRRVVVEHASPELPIGLEKLAAAEGLWVGEKK
jgi:uncharacterized protein YbaR (Trm112 family)